MCMCVRACVRAFVRVCVCARTFLIAPCFCTVTVVNVWSVSGALLQSTNKGVNQR